MDLASIKRLRRIEGRHNSSVKLLRQAFAHGERTESGACAIEGIRILEEAIRSGLPLEAVFFSTSAESKARRLLPQIGSHVETYLLPDRLFASAVPSESPQGVAALVRLREFSADDVIRASERGILVVVAGIQDPGNLGTLLRSAEAFDAAGVLLGENTVNLMNWKVVRASAGSVFRLPVARVSLSEAITKLRESGVRLLATSSHKGTPLHEVDWTQVAIFIGSEGAGLPREVISKLDGVIAIPHSAKVESLNAGVAGSILLFEAARSRRENFTAEADRTRTP
jgi:TrmH family RNA methyltransferase